MQQDDFYSIELNHMDRICIGMNTMFLFRYPQQKYQRDRLMHHISKTYPNLDPEDVEALYSEQMRS